MSGRRALYFKFKGSPRVNLCLLISPKMQPTACQGSSKSRRWASARRPVRAGRHGQRHDVFFLARLATPCGRFTQIISQFTSPSLFSVYLFIHNITGGQPHSSAPGLRSYLEMASCWYRNKSFSKRSAFGCWGPRWGVRPGVAALVSLLLPALPVRSWSSSSAQHNSHVVAWVRAQPSICSMAILKNAESWSWVVCMCRTDCALFANDLLVFLPWPRLLLTLQVHCNSHVVAWIARLFYPTRPPAARIFFPWETHGDHAGPGLTI